MGCYISRENSLQNEGLNKRCEPLIREAEKSLGIYELSATGFGMGIARFSNHGALDQQQIIRGLTNLGIDTSFFSKDKHPKKRFFNKFLLITEKALFSVVRLETLGVLLGTGDRNKKAETLFLNYDRNCSLSIDEIEFTAMINDILSISLEYTLDLAIDYFSGNPKTSLKLYKHLIAAKKDNVLRYFAHILRMDTREEITLQIFLNALNDYGFKKLFSTAECREIAYDYCQ